jgi:hypothetical protein
MYDMWQEDKKQGREYVGFFGSWYHFLSLMALMMRR